MLQISLFFLNPALVCMLAWALLGETVGALGICGVACSLFGVVLVSRPPFLFGGTEAGAAAAWTLNHMLGGHAIMKQLLFMVDHATCMRDHGSSCLPEALPSHDCSAACRCGLQSFGCVDLCQGVVSAQALTSCVRRCGCCHCCRFHGCLRFCVHQVHVQGGVGHVHCPVVSHLQHPHGPDSFGGELLQQAFIL